MDPILLIKGDALQVASGTKVLKSHQYSTYLKAEELIEQACKEAQDIIARGQAAYEEEKTRGYQDGLLEGKMSLSVQMMDTVAKTVDFFAELEEKVVEIVMMALRKIVGDMDAVELISRVAGNALLIAKNQKQVVLRVAPELADALRERIDDIMAGFPGISFIDVVGDSRLKADGCILETEMGIVDATVEVQLEAIQRSLMKSFKLRQVE